MRAPLLETLYRHVWDQEKVQFGEKVNRIDFENSRPTVICEGGARYTGDIVVGCDGVHSFVRREMWRMCELVEPTRIPLTDKTCKYLGAQRFVMLTQVEKSLLLSTKAYMEPLIR